MLDPNARSLLTDALRSPPGYTFDRAVATTYSLDLTTLLTIPLHLVLFAGGDDAMLLRDSIALLESIRRTAGRLRIFCQQGQIHVPTGHQSLFSLLEPVVVEARAPKGGAFHPKLWVLRFARTNGEGPPLLRLLVLTRNLTADRSWDLSLQLDGRPGKGARPENRPLGRLLAALPALAAHGARDGTADEMATLADETLRTEWELPGQFEEVRFHVLGLGRSRWSLPRFDQLVVISPFVTAEALLHLAGSSADPVAIISRPEELARLDPDVLRRFGRRFVLDENAETEDGEDPGTGPGAARGLHAKAYVGRRGWYTHLVTGSANATTAALLRNVNVEVLAELVGRRSRVGGIDDLLGEKGLLPMLVDFPVPEVAEEPDPLRMEAERALEEARRELAGAGLAVRCESEGDLWRLVLVPGRPIVLTGIAAARAWPVTLPRSVAENALGLKKGEEVLLASTALSSVSALVAFELVAAAYEERLQFVLNLPVQGLPPGRDAAVVRDIVRDREGFLRYLLLLLGETDAPGSAESIIRAWKRWRSSHPGGGIEELPLLEEMVRAFARDPARLHRVRELIEELGGSDTGVVPGEFRDLWQVFAEELGEVEK